MSRVLVFVEGQTEETFVRDLLDPYFAMQGIYLKPILAQTSPGHKGGIVSYGKVKHQVTRLCRQDQGAYVTTLIDYYGLPTDFPAFGNQAQDAHQRVLQMEQAIQQDIGEPNFIPNLLLHEFEALLFSAPAKFAEWLDDGEPVAELEAIRAAFESPEHINNSPQTAPSKRILALVPNYKKTLHGPLIAEDIGLDAIRAQCPHFNRWIERLLALPR
ncbi:DUF4276 family protein [Edwardsiella ictaluri]|jgi:hypothetical protein|uniref:DUF4276 family protein n=1 Tax=Edwardsiella ictaluri TaxID=67780 RepID=UPI0018DB3AD3|nr:DUF4276 family protein [Edwardsiella ictaluri]QPW27947.1 DUF4276 family protein [Edwardsiella ictaluri]